jgi:hypothetical protein
MINKLVFWNWIKTNKLTIPSADICSIKSDISTMQNELEKRKYLFEKIKEFWCVKEDVTAYCFYAKSDNIAGIAVGQWISNFKLSVNSLGSSIIMLMPSLLSNKMDVAEQVAIVAHEFSHAMYAASNHERIEKGFESIKSPNAMVASWYLDEALAVILGNGIFRESVSKKEVDLTDQDRCAPGFAPALYNIAKDYWKKSKSIDKAFLNEAVRLFDKIYPNGYINPNVCLYRLHVICPDFISENDLFFQLSRKTPINQLCVTHYSELNNEKLKEIKNSNTSILIVDQKGKLPLLLKKMLPKFDRQNMTIISKNRKTYVLIKIDDKHSLEDCINELFSRTNN